MILDTLEERLGAEDPVIESINDDHYLFKIDGVQVEVYRTRGYQHYKFFTDYIVNLVHNENSKRYATREIVGRQDEEKIPTKILPKKRLLQLYGVVGKMYASQQRARTRAKKKQLNSVAKKLGLED